VPAATRSCRRARGEGHPGPHRFGAGAGAAV